MMVTNELSIELTMSGPDIENGPGPQVGSSYTAGPEKP
jgi:hypothetical protein